MHDCVAKEPIHLLPEVGVKFEI